MALGSTITQVTDSGLKPGITFPNFVSTGIATATNFKTGTSNLHNVGLEVAGINVLGGDTPIGTGATVWRDGGALFSGIVSATSFYGDISNATGAAAGLGTALSQTQTDPLNKLYYTDSVLSVGATITVDPPSSASAAYTQYTDIVVEDTADLIMGDGDDLIPDILGLSTETATVYSATGGRIRAGTFTNAGANGAPTAPNGWIVTGVSTATTFKGNLIGNVTGTASQLETNATGANLTLSGNLGVGGTITYEDVARVDATGISTFREGFNLGPLAGIALTAYKDGSIRTTGIITASSFVGSLAASNLTGALPAISGANLTGIDASSIKFGSDVKVQANASGAITTGIATATLGVGIGTTTVAGVLAGVGTAIGTLTFAVDKGLQCYVGTAGWNTLIDTVTLPTGGTVTTSGGYRIHTWALANNNTALGVFNISSGGMTRNIEFLVVGGGGGGGQDIAGGGGAGGYAEGSMNLAPGTYKIEVGNGGSKALNGQPARQGGTSRIFLSLQTMGVNENNIIANGGGAGEGCSHHSGTTSTAGGCGGGGGANVGSGNQASQNSTIVGATFTFNGGGNGGTSNCNTNGSGGGGASGNGTQSGDGGAGKTSTISGSSVTYAGGGSGANSSNSISNGGGSAGGGGASNGTRNGVDGKGGGGAAGYGGWGSGGEGGDGIVIIRYKL